MAISFPSSCGDEKAHYKRKNVENFADPLRSSLHAGGWMVEKTGIRNEVAILDSRG